MIAFKVYYHILSFLKIHFFKLLYRGRLQLGKNLQFRKGFTLMIDCGKIEVSDNVFFNNYCTLCAMNRITIGEGTIFGESVKIYDHNHIYSDHQILIKNQGYSSAPINIGRHCWIGSNVTILKGVTIGDNCVIGAGCVIFKDVPMNSVVVNKQELISKNIK